MPGEALRCGEKHVSIRVNPALVRETVLTPRALTMVGTAGTHRAYFTPESDRLVLEALEAAPSEGPETAEILDWSTVDWEDTDQITHLDALTPERFRILPFAGGRRIAARVIPFLLSHLTDMSLPFTLVVPGGGCVQLHRGRATLVEFAGNHVAAVFGSARYAMDPAAAAECWVTRTHSAAGPMSSVELYDHDDRCVTVITQTGPVCDHLHDAWEAIVEALPDYE